MNNIIQEPAGLVDRGFQLDFPEKSGILFGKQTPKYQGAEFLKDGFAGSKLAYTVKVNGVIIGTDKIGHFFEEGLKAFIASDRGKNFKAALDFSIEDEDGLHGAAFGIFSMGDIEANIRGYFFWKGVYDDLNCIKKPTSRQEVDAYKQKIIDYFKKDLPRNFKFSSHVTEDFNEYNNPNYVGSTMKAMLKKKNKLFNEKDYSFGAVRNAVYKKYIKHLRKKK